MSHSEEAFEQDQRRGPSRASRIAVCLPIPAIRPDRGIGVAGLAENAICRIAAFSIDDTVCKGWALPV